MTNSNPRKEMLIFIILSHSVRPNWNTSGQQRNYACIKPHRGKDNKTFYSQIKHGQIITDKTTILQSIIKVPYFLDC